jgi:hypothetical protein
MDARRTVRILMRLWDAIERVAAALSERGVLTGDDVERLVRGLR